MAGHAQTFADALQAAEASRDPAPVAALFADGAELSNLAITESGEGAAERFWRTYLDQFDRVASTFSRLFDGGGQGGTQSALVWTSEGALKDGHPITYRGVSILEMDGDRVRRFETYYDSAAFLRRDAPGSGGA